ncbi:MULTISPECIES: DUF317 domain-containing protein [Streptomyces]|uniref:DUF317 domain-containing protein n=1 Tax=Streptomyces evansiae TaxID=3075535 RepID=A0ABU2QUV9_9ACTN|nr:MULTISPECIES: DUF317 domain-containing protein [unclassified Streptomyces]MDT0407778.1 DUF317 domain-containing protein [Streptomyces sp. DSM 41979]MYQ60900.1 DUF317 domain-containing protein [Streptomyces sp. SID4926]SCE23719.1 protein of unknown function [Streptomyces sp. DfronAA-171]
MPSSPSVLARDSALLSDYDAGPLLDLLTVRGWTLAETPLADVHATSPDGRLYIGWLPEDPGAWARGIHVHVTATPVGHEPWTQEFGIGTPLTAVTRFVTALLD